MDYEVIRAVQQGRQGTIVDLVPYDPAVFIYEPGVIPEDVQRDFPELVVGSAPDFRINGGITSATTANVLSVDVLLGDVERARPIANGDVVAWSGIVLPGGFGGGAVAFDAVNDPGAHDGDTSYVFCSPGAPTNTDILFKFSALALPLAGAQIASAGVGYVIRHTAGAGTGGVTGIVGPDRQITFTPIIQDTTNTFQTFEDESLTNPLTNQPWRPQDFGVAASAPGGGLQFGVRQVVPAGAEHRLTQVYRIVRLRQDKPDALGLVKLWRKGPSASQPSAPTEADEPIATATQQLFGLSLPSSYPGGTGTYWYWVAVYDVMQRRVALLGPRSLVIS